MHHLRHLRPYRETRRHPHRPNPQLLLAPPIRNKFRLGYPTVVVNRRETPRPSPAT